jgi:2-polyprenyl-6-hydroxyphenyl methylase/3-demethylubiquinone-9 3-methyltransferase
MAARGASVTGIDLSDKALRVARLHLLETGQKVDYQLVAAEAFAEQHAEQFDVVTCMEMLEHVPEPSSVVDACARLVKPGGWVFLSTLNRNAKSYLMAIIGAEYVLNMLPKGTHDWARFLKPSELGAMVRAAGLETVDIQGMTYNPLDKTYKLGSDTGVNYLLACRRA